MGDIITFCSGMILGVILFYLVKSMNIPEHKMATEKNTMQPHQQRVIDEKKELDEKINKLTVFIDTSSIFENLPVDEKSRLDRQLGVMEEYSNILKQRIAAFEQ